MELKIKRSQWIRGVGAFRSALLVQPGRDERHPEDTGKMCCLGFLAKECGYTDDEIKGRGEPKALIRHNDRFPETITRWNGQYNYADLIKVNDDRDLSSEQREAKLTELFADRDITVTFED